MAGNTNTLSKKTIVAIVIAIVLLFVASLSVGIFLANRGDAEAAGGNQISDVNQTENNNQNTSSDNNQAPDQNTNIENNNTDSNNTENNNTENNNPETPNTDGNAGTVVDNNKTTNNNTNNNGTVNNAENNTENRTNNNTAGVTTDANVNQVGETTVTRVEERERLVSRDYWDWWTPTSVAVASTATRLSPTTPDITVEKVAMTEAGKNVVYAGQKITYTITVKNSGKKDVEKIEVTDKIPSNTTFESVENDGTVIKSENEEILGVKWLVDVKTGETTSVKFTVIVNENIEGTISNIAVANGEESNEENTAIITSEKTSEISRDGQKVEIAKVGDEIKYTITVNNTGKVDGITTISDKVPEGTELKANSAEGAKISDNNDMLLWENISVPAEGTVSKSFVVIVKNIDSLKANKISNVATVGGKDTNPTEDTAATDITVTKVWKNMDSDAAKANIIDSIKLQLKANGEVADEAVVTADEDWTHTFTDLPMYDENENKITYTIDEVVVNDEDQAKLDLYNKSIENGVITNTFDPSKLTDKTEVTATKVWANMDSDAARANTITSIKLQVKANGEVAAEQVVTAENNWTYTFKDLPVYDKAGNRITYTIDEVVANAEDQTKLGLYVKTIDQAKGIITNTFDPSKLTDKTEVTATKVWANMDSDAARANTITSIKLQVKANGEVSAEQVVTAENNWTYTFTGLPVYDKAGNRITYTIDEVVANAEDQTKLGLYVKTIDQAKGIITNTFDPSKLTDKTEVTATKAWANMNSDAARTNTITSIKLQVKANGEVAAEQVVTAENNWTYTFKDLPVYDEAGNRITYTIDEAVANAEDQTKLGLYVKTIDQEKGIITNTFDPSKLTDKTEVSATKVWANMNSDAARTNTITSIKLQVKANGEVAAEQVVTAENNWTYTFKDLPVYDEAGNRITYTIDEAVANAEDQSKLSLYNKSIENGVITNTFDPSKLTDKTEVSATKVWANMNSDAARTNTITSIKLQVKANGEVAAEQVVTAENNWTYTFTGLPVYDKAGNRITYTIDEVVANAEDQTKLGLYVKTIDQAKGIITNTFDPSKLTDKTEVTATKVWANMDSDAARANTITSIKLQVKANGEVSAEQVVTAENNWTYTFTGLPVYDKAGNRITYTIDEVVANAKDQTKLGLYVKTIDQAKGIITNTFDPSKLTDKTEVTATKVWANMDSDAARANTITSIKLQVKANGEVAAEQVVTAENNWTYTFKDLPVYDKAGNRITYTIDEVVANAEDQTKLGLYVKTIDQAKGIITNTFDPSKLTDKTEVTATKVWANMDSDAARANTITSIKLQVKANGEVSAEQVVTAENNWTYTFTGLPVYDKAGNRITYTIDEVVANAEDQTKLGLYVKTIDQAKGIITNTFDPSKLTDKTEVTATKVWANMDSDAARTNTITSIKLQVKANGEVSAEQVVTAENNWIYTFKDLPVYDKAGNRITYTIDEVVANAEDQTKLGLYVKTIDQAKGIITNTFDPSKLTDKTEVTATKVWANMDSDAARTNTITSIKLQVKANGEVSAEQVVTAENNWIYTFKDLPVYDKAGNRITYTIDEVVANAEDQTKLGLYVKTIDQAKGIITNTFDPSKLTDKTEVSATKVWANMDSDAARANTITSIKLQVKANGEVSAEQVVTAENSWTYTFTGLPVYDKAGNRITYTIDEVVANTEDQSKLSLYNKSIENGVITNTFDPSEVQDEKITLIMTKVWQDNNNSFNTRPLEVKLTVDNKEYKLTGDMNAEKWTAETVELKKYDEQGNLINYTATENTVPTGYEKVSEEGLTVTNRANELINKTAYKVDANGNIGSPATNKDTFAANETVYYKITLTNAGSEPISKTVTDEIPLRLTLNTVDGKTGESGTTYKGDNWTVTKNDKEQSVVTWEVKDLAAGDTRELIIKATVVAEAEYKDICNKTIDGTTAYTAKLFVRKDGKVPYEGSGTGYDASLYTGELGTVYLNSSDLHYDTNANLKNDDLYYLIKNNNIITDMVAKGITRTQLVDALKTNGTILADDEVVVWYVIKNESDGYHIDGVIRKISSLTEITNTAFTDKVSSDSTIKLEDIEIGQRGSITVKSITSSTDTVSTPMDVVFVLDTSGSMTDPLKGKNEMTVENSRAKAMVNAVNSSIKTIMSKNKDSRVGVVGFSGDASTIIPLGNYAQNIDYLTREYSAGGLMYSSSQTIKSNVGNKSSRQVTGGTNTQSGIKLGAEMLISNQNTTTATVTLKDGTTKTITRTPLLILVTDGEPTYYYASETATGKLNGHGYTKETDENYYYWTLRTAKYYKDQITNKYYPKNTDKTAKVFTIGIGLKGNEAVAMLDPTEKNVNACNNNNSQQKALYKLIRDNGKIAPGAYSYATGSKTGEITESDLTGFLNTSIDSSTDNEKNRAITTEESKARRVELGTINEEKEFSLTVGTDSYTSLNAAMKAGYVKKATSTTYYLDLSEISRSTNVEIVYWN